MTKETTINTKHQCPPASGGVRWRIIMKNLCVNQQGNTMLDAVSFQLNYNEHLAIIGSSGSGKTTLAKALARKIFFHGTIEFSIENCSINFVEQHYHFKNRSNTNDFYYQQRYNSFDSSDALTVTEELQALSSNDDDANTLLDRLQLSHRKQSPLLHLSSGEHKRFQLIKALLVPSQILILDEPFVGLDLANKWEIYRLLKEEREQNGMTTIVTTHDIPEAILLANRILVVRSTRGGTVIEAIENEPADLDAADMNTVLSRARRRAAKVEQHIHPSRGA